MSTPSTAASSSSPTVAGQQLLAFEASYDFQQSIQGVEIVQHDDEEYDSWLSSPPETPGLLWDSRSSSGQFPETPLKSVFEDWEDKTPSLSNPSIIVEDDGAQTVLIPSDSPYFNPPPLPKPFGFAPFSKGLLTAIDMPLKRESVADEVPASAIVPITPDGLVLPEQYQEQLPGDKPSQGLMLFVDTTSLHPSFGNGVSLSSLAFYTPGPRLVDELQPSWAPQDSMCGPDVPLDCIYSSGGISPAAEHWTETWSSIEHTSPFRATPWV
ncbi:hypothetical protein BDZ97DRAFT_1924704 [Flammula alnicola]|nr:hypothetical protein BDZ97DRAFT_1924704 [Flammula alnicola]